MEAESCCEEVDETLLVVLRVFSGISLIDD